MQQRSKCNTSFSLAETKSRPGLARLRPPRVGRGSGIWLGGLLLASALLALGTPALGQGTSPIAKAPKTFVTAGAFPLPAIHSVVGSGKPTGFSIDMLEAVVAKAGLKVRYQVFPTFPDALRALADGRIDLLPNVGIIRSREKELDFSIPVQTIPIALFVRAATIDIEKLSDLVGRTLAVVEANIGIQLAAQELGVRAQVHTSIGLALSSLVSGEADGLIYPETMLWNRATELGIQNLIKTAGPLLREVKRGIAVKTGNQALLDRLNPAISQVLTSPEYPKMLSRWYVRAPTYWSARNLAIWMGSGLLVIVTLLGGWHYLRVVGLNRRLGETERRYARAVEGTHDGLWDWNIETGEEYFSPRWLEILGYPPGALKEHVDTFVDLIHPDDRERVWQAVEKHLHEGEEFDLELRMRNKQGGHTWIRSRGQAQRDSQGKAVHMAGSISDITQEIEAREALRQSEERLSLIFNTILELLILFRVEPDGRFTVEAANPAYTGYIKAMFPDAPDLVGMERGAYLAALGFDRELIEVEMPAFRETVGTGVSSHYEMTTPGLTALVALSISLEPVMDQDGRCTHLLWSASDVSARKMAEDQLRESEARLRWAETLSRIGHYALAPDGASGVWSDGLKAICGFPLDSNPLWEDLLARLHPEDLEPVMGAFAKAGKEGIGFDLEFRLVLPDRALVEVHSIGEMTTDKITGEARYFGSMIDITEYKRAERELKRLNEELEQRVAERTASLSDALELNERILSISAIGISAYDGTGQCIFANEAIAKMVGASREGVLAQNFHAIESGKEHGLSVVAERVMETGETQSGEFHLTSSFDREIWVDCFFARFLRDGEKNLLLMVNDITERKLAELEVAGMRDQMAAQQKMATVGQLTATVSHELRNPLGTIRTSIFSLKERLGGKDAATTRSLERVERNVARCDNIINDLLDYSRTRGSHPEPTPVDTWLRVLLTEQTLPAWLELEFTGGAEGLELDLDQDRFRRAVINLVENAVQAMEGLHGEDPNHPCRLAIHTQTTAENVEVTVSDTGPGMTPEIQAKIFEPLFSTKTYGVGLGLPTVQQLIEQEGGGIQITSEPGQGTTAMVWLPLAGHIRKVS